MKRLGLAGAVALALCGASAASAADLAKAYPVKAMPTPVFSWTGFYVGGNVGYGWGQTASSGNIYGFLDYYYDYFSSSSSSLGADGWFGGVQAGYNFQYANNVVLGIEADFS